MLNTRKPVEEIKAILEAMNFFEKVSVGKIDPLTSTQTLPAVYISYDSDINEPNGKLRNDGGEYDRMLYLTLEVHLDLTDKHDLYYLDVRDMVEEALLKDNQLWQNVVDRDVIGSKWDTGANLPKKQGEIAIVLFTRACVN
jgi:hypothetical protein